MQRVAITLQDWIVVKRFQIDGIWLSPVRSSNADCLSERPFGLRLRSRDEARADEAFGGREERFVD